ncbi:hypothetical protein AMECASPLE_014326, partial [Ameca splendens]
SLAEVKHNIQEVEEMEEIWNYFYLSFASLPIHYIVVVSVKVNADYGLMKTGVFAATPFSPPKAATPSPASAPSI